MKKKIIIALAIIGIPATSFCKNVEINMVNLSKKWMLEKYQAFWIDYDVEPNEINDFIHLKPTKRYNSVDQGKPGSGTWRIHHKNDEYYLILQEEKGELQLIIKELEKDKLVLVIDDEELIDLKICFVAQ